MQENLDGDIEHHFKSIKYERDWNRELYINLDRFVESFAILSVYFKFIID